MMKENAKRRERAYKPTAYDRSKRTMRVFDVPPNMGKIARHEAFSQIRAAIHRAIELQIAQRQKRCLGERRTSQCKTWWQHLQENRRKHGRIL